MASSYRQHLQDPRAAPADPLHAGAARGLPRRHLRHDAGRQPRRDEAGHDEPASGTFLGLFNMFSGGALEQLSIFALGIMPYVSASIILQLLTVVVPDARAAAERGRAGPAEDQPVHALRHDRAVAGAGVRHRALPRGPQPHATGSTATVVAQPGPRASSCMTVITLTTGTAFIMWLGEQITERGIGNGISLIIFAGIVAALPGRGRADSSSSRRRGQLDGVRSLFIVAGIVVAVIAAIVFVERGAAADPGPVRQARGRPEDVRRPDDAPAAQGQRRRRHPADLRVVDPDVPGAAREHVAASPGCRSSPTMLQPGDWRYNVLYVALIIFFCYFYTAVTFNPVDVADNMKKHGGFIPGIRPGKTDGRVHRPRAHAHHVRRRALHLGGLRAARRSCSSSFNVPFSFGGTGAAHRRRRRARHRAADRGAPHHAQLRRLHRAQGPAHPRPRGAAARVTAWRVEREPDPARARRAPARERRRSGSRRASASRRSRPATCCARRVARARRSASRPRSFMDAGAARARRGRHRPRRGAARQARRARPASSSTAFRARSRRPRRSTACCRSSGAPRSRVVDVQVPEATLDRAARRAAVVPEVTARRTT